MWAVRVFEMTKIQNKSSSRFDRINEADTIKVFCADTIVACLFKLTNKT